MEPHSSFKHSMAFAILSVLVAILSIQSGASLAKQLFPLIGAQGTTSLRLAIAALILCLVSRPWRTKLSYPEIRTILAYGVSLGIMNSLFYLSLERIPQGIAVALEFTGPLAVAVLSSRKATDFLWAILAIIGILLILPVSQSSAALDPLGIFLALGAGVSWAFYIIFGQKAGATTHAGTVTALGMLAAAILVFPIGVIHAGSDLLNPTLIPAALGVAILSSALPYSLEMRALKKIPAKNFGILMSLEPAVGACVGLVFLNEYLTFTQWVAIACIILASVGSSATAKTRPKAKPKAKQ